jgi:hypothetical protein
MLEGIRHKWFVRHRPAKAVPGSTERRTARASAQPAPQVPEWGTDRWKRQVEAEARNRLKRDVRDIGARRN